MEVTGEGAVVTLQEIEGLLSQVQRSHAYVVLRRFREMLLRAIQHQAAEEEAHAMELDHAQRRIIPAQTVKGARG